MLRYSDILTFLFQRSTSKKGQETAPSMFPLSNCQPETKYMKKLLNMFCLGVCLCSRLGLTLLIQLNPVTQLRSHNPWKKLLKYVLSGWVLMQQAAPHSFNTTETRLRLHNRRHLRKVASLKTSILWKVAKEGFAIVGQNLFKMVQHTSLCCRFCGKDWITNE